MSQEAKICLNPVLFDRQPQTLLCAGELEAAVFRFGSGVRALRLKNAVGSLTTLPFQGQQIWDLHFMGRNLTMKSMFSEPKPTQTYLENYGGFLLHCGAMAMGVPSAEDRHPLHGELPNAPFQEAFLTIGKDSKGRFLSLTGTYQHTVAFTANYVARPLIRLWEESSEIEVSISIRNLMKSPMDLMYLAHANFRPLDHGRLLSTAHYTPEHCRVRSSLPPNLTPPKGYREFLAELEVDPERHAVLEPDLTFDPEVVLYLDCIADEEGWAHSLQIHPDGTADFISHRPSQLEHGVRWISRTGDQDALGLLLPATAEPEGYLAEKRKGHLKVLKSGEEFHAEMLLGALGRKRASQLARKIQDIVKA